MKSRDFVYHNFQNIVIFLMIKKMGHGVESFMQNSLTIFLSIFSCKVSVQFFMQKFQLIFRSNFLSNLNYSENFCRDLWPGGTSGERTERGGY
jgi:hypothetical protein